MSFDTMHYKDDINLRIEKYKQDRMEKEQPRATGIEAQVCYDIAKRQELGLKKYGVSLEENNLKTREWLQHAYEEALDLACYLKRLIVESEK